MEMLDSNKKIGSEKGAIYFKTVGETNKATIQYDDGIVMEIWNLAESDLIKLLMGCIILTTVDIITSI